ncbi:MAG: hypothetical protein II404_06135 [Prevotella sp.]|nr:hypothetical protein [Prevotella sp.]
MKKQLLSMAVMMMGATLFTACNDKDSTPTIVPVLTSDGAYVICGGNEWSAINSSVTYIDYNTSSAAQNQFAAKNGRSLGMTANDAVVYGTKMYIVVSGENTIEVVDAKTLKSIRQIKTTELMGAEKGVMPRHLAIDGGVVYVSTYGSSASDWETYTTSGNGYVAAIDTTTYSLLNTYTAGSYPEGLDVYGGILYVANSDYSMGSKASISAINLSSGASNEITNSIIVNPTDVAVAGNGIYVLDMGNYADVAAGVRRVSGTTVTTLFDATHCSFIGSNIYACNSIYGTIPSEFFVYNILTGNKETFSTGLDRFFSPNVVTADPITGRIYIASYNENADNPGYANYSTNGYVAEYSQEGKLLKTYDCGVGPNAIVFNTGLKYVEQK